MLAWCLFPVHVIAMSPVALTGGYMDLMTAEQAGHFLQSQANNQSGSLPNGDLPHAQHTQATHNGHQVAAGLAQVPKHLFCSDPCLCWQL